MTPKQERVLALVREGEVIGRCERYVWKFTAGHENVTAPVKALEKLGLVSISYYSGGRAGVS